MNLAKCGVLSVQCSVSGPNFRFLVASRHSEGSKLGFLVAHPHLPHFGCGLLAVTVDFFQGGEGIFAVTVPWMWFLRGPLAMRFGSRIFGIRRPASPVPYTILTPETRNSLGPTPN